MMSRKCRKHIIPTSKYAMKPGQMISMTKANGSCFMLCATSLIITAHLSIASPAWADVVYHFERMWPTLQQPWYFNNTRGVSFSPDGTAWIADSGNKRVIRMTEDGRFLNQFGSSGNGPGQFSVPIDIHVCDDGSAYVTDSGNHRVQKFDSQGEYMLHWGSPGSAEGQFNQPWGITADRETNIYVTDRQNHRIQVFDRDGVFLRQWGSLGAADGELNTPEAAVVGPNDLIYVADSTARVQIFTLAGTYVSKWNRKAGDLAISREGFVYAAGATAYGSPMEIYALDGSSVGEWDTGTTGPLGMFSFFAMGPNGHLLLSQGLGNSISVRAADGLPLARWAASGDGQDRMNYPCGGATFSNGNICLADKANNRILIFTPNGSFVEAWTSGDLWAPRDLAIDSNDNVYVTDTNHSRIVQYTATGTVSRAWGSTGSADGEFKVPSGIALDSSGYVYVTDYDNNRVQKFTATGQFVAKWGATGTEQGNFKAPYGIDLDSNDNVYVAEYLGSRVQKFTSDGQFIRLWGRTGTNGADGLLLNPRGLTVDSENMVHVADWGRSQVQVFDADGAFIKRWGAKGQDAGQFNGPEDVIVGDQGSIFVSDSTNHRVQKFKQVDLLANAKAIIVTGGGPYAGNNLWEATQASANYAYRSLTFQGFTKETIQYISSDTDLDLDGNGMADDVDAACTLENIEHALTTWAPAVHNGLPTSDVVVYLVDHGGTGTFRVSQTEVLDAPVLASWLDTMQSEVTGKAIIVYDACESGSFVPHLSNPAYEGRRIIITSTSPEESAYFVSTGTVSFSNYFWTRIFNGTSVGEAFDEASDALGLVFQYQTPLLEDTMDGTASKSGDGALAAATHIGNGTRLFWEAPTVGGVSPPQTLDATATATLWADPVTDTDGVARVWAVIRPPDFAAGSSSTPVTGLPGVDLFPTRQDSPRWEADHAGFTTAGTHTVLIYARDQVGNTSVPVMTTVTVGNPLSRKALLVAGGDASSPLWPAVERMAQTAHRALTSQGYGNDDIQYLSRTTTAGVDGLAVLANARHACTDWVTGSTQDFTVYLIGPATPTGFAVSPTEELAWTQLKAWLDDLQETLPGQVAVVCDADGSGSVLPLLKPAQGKARIVASSAAAGQPAGWLRNGSVSFTKYFWGQVANGATTAQAFAYAAQAVRFATGQTAQLDDNGDGVYNSKTDGALARRHWIGNGILLAGDEPVIGAIMPPQTVSGTPSATVWVEQVTTTGTIADVTALVFPPGGLPAVEVPLADAGGNRWEAEWAGFTQAGAYRVSVVATDTLGQSSLPVETTVTQQSIFGPDAYEPDDTPGEASWIGLDAEEDQRHNFHVEGDEDWVAFFAEAGTTVTIETNNLGPVADTYIELYRADGVTLIDSNDDRPLDLSSYLVWTVDADGIYLVRVTHSPFAIDPGHGDGSEYDLRVWRESGPVLTGTLSVTVNALSGGGIAQATVTVSRVSPYWSRTQKTGLTGLSTWTGLDAGSYTVSVAATGYQSQGPRSTSITAGLSNPELFTLSPAATLAISPGERAVSAAAGSTTFDVSNGGTGTMTWAAEVTAGGDWLAVTGGATGTAPGAVQASFAQNTGASERAGTIRITGTGAGGVTASGSPSEVTVRQAAAPDTTPPVITVLGANPVTVTLGQTYSDPGATATDDRDGDLTAAIVKTSNVNTGVVGTYWVKYNVSDAAGNPAQEKTRTVYVSAVTNLPEAWVDAAWTGPEAGTEAQPFNTLTEAITALATGGTVRVKGDTGKPKIAETPRIAKALRIEASGGPVRIGDLSAPAGGGMEPESALPAAGGMDGMDLMDLMDMGDPVDFLDRSASLGLLYYGDASGMSGTPGPGANAPGTEAYAPDLGTDTDCGPASANNDLSPPEGTHPISGAGPVALALLCAALAALISSLSHRSPKSR